MTTLGESGSARPVRLSGIDMVARRAMRASAVLACAAGGFAVSAALATPALAGDRTATLTGPVTGSVVITHNDPYCPNDDFFPSQIEPHEHYEGTIDNGGAGAHLVVDVCQSSDGGALGGNTFSGRFRLTDATGSLRGYAAGSQTNLPNERFFVNLSHGRGAPPLLAFSGCWGATLPTGLALLDARVDTADSVVAPTCGIP
jgi:hypothetical protein